MTVLEARRHPTLRRFALRRHRLSVASGTLSIIGPRQLEADPRGRLGAWQRLGEPPYWGQVWHASVGLARYLCRGDRLDGISVLDLGCGLGVAGCAALRMGARVTFADCEEPALSFAAFNGAAAVPAGREPALATRRLDWNRETIGGSFDLVLLADVTYRAVHHAGVLRQLRAGLGHHGQALHCDPFRRESSRFLERAASEFELASENMDAHFDGQRLPLRLTRIRRRRGRTR